MKATTFHNNEHTNIIISKPDITPKECRENLKNNHTTVTSQYLSSRKNKKVIITTPYNIHLSELILPLHMCAKLPHLRANKSTLASYLHTVNPETYTPQYCSMFVICKHTNETNHSLTVVKYQNNTNTTSLWKKPLVAAEIIQEWGSRLASLRD